MIEILGQSPISSIPIAVRSEFISVLQNNPSKALFEGSRGSRPYVSTRGILINKDYVNGIKTPDFSLGYVFQFNPQTINDIKGTLYETRQYAGLPYNDYIWGGGGERIITFQLFLDNTPQSKQRYFRPTAYGSKLANEIDNNGSGYTFDEHSGRYNKSEEGLNVGLLNEIASVSKTIRESLVPTKGPSSFDYVDNGAYSDTRVSERGILDEVEKIQSYLYPALNRTDETPLFSEGGVVNTEQFRPPVTLILSLGPLYLEGVLKSAPITYSLFDKDLTPLRGTIDVEFAVFEFENIEKQINWRT